MNISKSCIRVLGAAAVLLGMLTLNGASAMAAGAPIVTTEPASSVLPYSANLNGTVSQNGATTTYQFEYGTTTGYGSSTTVQTAPAPEPSSVSVPVAGLLPETAYHYRISATNSYGTTLGKDATFTTLGWSVEEQHLKELGGTPKFISGGSMVINTTLSGDQQVSIGCSETGSGTVGGKMTLSLSSCTVSVNGEGGLCTLKPFAFSVNEAFVKESKTEGKLLFSGAKCIIPEEVNLHSGGFAVAPAFENVELPVTLKGVGFKFGAQSAEVSIASKWHLVETYVGQRFGLGWRVEGLSLTKHLLEETGYPYAFTSPSTTATFEFASWKVTVSCQASQEGSLGLNDKITLVNCSSPNCTATASAIQLNAAFTPAEGSTITGFEFKGSKCTMPEGLLLVKGGSFTVVAGAEQASLPVTLTNAAKYGTQTVNIGISSTWSLGPGGKKFGTTA